MVSENQHVLPCPVGPLAPSQRHTRQRDPRHPWGHLPECDSGTACPALYSLQNPLSSPVLLVHRWVLSLWGLGLGWVADTASLLY
jgi:hypothetical protein